MDTTPKVEGEESQNDTQEDEAPKPIKPLKAKKKKEKKPTPQPLPVKKRKKTPKRVADEESTDNEAEKPKAKKKRTQPTKDEIKALYDKAMNELSQYKIENLALEHKLLEAAQTNKYYENSIEMLQKHIANDNDVIRTLKEINSQWKRVTEMTSVKQSIAVPLT